MSLFEILLTIYIVSLLILPHLVLSGRVDDLRAELLAEFESRPQLYHERDVALIANTTNDWPVERYLKHTKGDMKKSFDLAIEALQWRASYGINNITAAEFPCEFLYSGLIQMTTDREGAPLVVTYIETFRRFPDVREHLIRYIGWIVELADREGGPRGFGGFVSLANAGIENIDPPLMRYLFPIPYRYPAAAKHMVVNEAGVILTPVVRMIVSWMPSEIQHLVKLTSGPTAYKYVRRANLPKCAGGRLAHTAPPTIVPNPEECVGDIWKVARRMGWSRENTQFYLSIVSPYVKIHQQAKGKG